MKKLVILILFILIFYNSQLITHNSFALESHTYYYHTDQVGSVTAVSDENGNIVQQSKYLPYGQEISITNNQNPNNIQTPNPNYQSERTYTGQIKDSTTNLSYYNARYYDPILSRFISADSTNDQQNRYNYVGGNPVMRNDPSGNCKEDDYDENYCGKYYDQSVLEDINKEFGVNLTSAPGEYWTGYDINRLKGILPQISQQTRKNTEIFKELTSTRDYGGSGGFTEITTNKIILITDVYNPNKKDAYLYPSKEDILEAIIPHEYGHLSSLGKNAPPGIIDKYKEILNENSIYIEVSNYNVGDLDPRDYSYTFGNFGKAIMDFEQTRQTLIALGKPVVEGVNYNDQRYIGSGPQISSFAYNNIFESYAEIYANYIINNKYEGISSTDIHSVYITQNGSIVPIGLFRSLGY